MKRTLLITLTALNLFSWEIISYDAFIAKDPEAIATLKKALHEEGIVGVRGIPTYKEKVAQFIEAAKYFSSLDESVKETYALGHSEEDQSLGYEKGKEKFQRPDGTWVIDDLKNSYYAFVPNNSSNKWPRELDLKTPFLNIASLMSDIGQQILDELGILSEFSVKDVSRVGRMLHYQKHFQTENDNPYWCGAHYDHSVFTALLPAIYFANGEQIPEPLEAGLFVRPTNQTTFKKVPADDLDVMLFQVGEFGQLSSNDAIQATEHRVHKAQGQIDRYTMALFFDASMQTVIRSTSALTSDNRYGANAGESCSYQHWSEESFKRYIVK